MIIKANFMYEISLTWWYIIDFYSSSGFRIIFLLFQHCSRRLTTVLSSNWTLNSIDFFYRFLNKKTKKFTRFFVVLEIGFLIFSFASNSNSPPDLEIFLLLFRFFLSFFCGAIKRLYFSEHSISFVLKCFIHENWFLFLSLYAESREEPHWGNFGWFLVIFFWLDDGEK